MHNRYLVTTFTLPDPGLLQPWQARIELPDDNGEAVGYGLTEATAIADAARSLIGEN